MRSVHISLVEEYVFIERNRFLEASCHSPSKWELDLML
jgi:hypothetical protein